MTHPVEEADARRRVACVAGDLAVLNETLADDLVYVHSSAQQETKAEMIERFRNGGLAYKRMDLVSSTVRDFGDTVVVHGDMGIHAVLGGVEKDFTARFTQVWRNNGGAWQLAAWQSTTIPG